MRFLFFACLISVVIFVCSSCSYKQNQILFEQKTTIQDTVLQKNFSNIRNYRIRPQDVLQIKNLQNSKTIVDLNPRIGTSSGTQEITTVQSENYQVEDDGTIGLTGLGRVQVAGLTRVEAMKKVEDMYHKDFLKTPLIDLKIINLKVTVLGEIKSQGNYILTKDKTTLVEIIGEAGGLTDKANEKNIKIIRGDETNQIVQIIDLNNIKSINDPRGILQSGDIIYIAQNNRAVRVDKNQTFGTTIQPELLILSTALLLFSIIRH
jgi:polysaccharide export outer membrane protein